MSLNNPFGFLKNGTNQTDIIKNQIFSNNRGIEEISFFKASNRAGPGRRGHWDPEKKVPRLFSSITM